MCATANTETNFGRLINQLVKFFCYSTCFHFKSKICSDDLSNFSALKSLVLANVSVGGNYTFLYVHF